MLTSGEGAARGPSTHAARVLQQGLEYLGHGWQLVPTFGIAPDGRCTCGQAHVGTAERTRGKHPIQKSWQTQPITDDEQLQAAVERWPLMNLGVLLGPGSGVIDIEWDDETGKQTAQRLGLTKIITPTYRSGRSEHRLFRWDERLPKSAVAKVAGLEIRIGGDGRGSQSILPPSRHWAGGAYEWLAGLGPDETDAAPVPDEVIDLIRSGGGPVAGLVGGSGGGIWDHGETLRTGPSSRTLIEESAITEGSRNDILFRGALGIARQWTGLERADVQAAFAEMIRSANIAKMKPPLEDEEVAKVIASAVRYALQTPTAASGRKDVDAIETRQVGSGTPRTWIEHGLSCSGGVYGPGDWQMTIIESDPPVYRLHVPAWVELTDDRTGTVTIDAEWLQKPAAVATAILKATKSVSFSGPEWKMLWMGSRKQPSLHNALLAEAHREPAPPEMQEWVPAAEHLLRQIDAAIEGTDPDDAGIPVWVDGVCWFEWPVVFDQAVQMGRLTKAVVERLYRRLDMIHRPRRLWPEAETGRRRQYGLSRQVVGDLRRMARGGA